MAGQDLPLDPARALEYKEKGNVCFQAGDYAGAEALYTKAINHDPTNPLFYTNRAMSLLHLTKPPTTAHYEQVIADSKTSISLLPENMKAYYQLAQAQIALHQEVEALDSAKIAHKLCVEECRKVPMGKGSSSIGHITELVLRCKREWWEAKETKRLKERGGLLEELVAELEAKRDERIEKEIAASAVEGDSVEDRNRRIFDIEARYSAKIEELRSTFEQAGIMGAEGKRRTVPDWCIDDITFSVMLDPVVTKTGQSYDRSSLMEHLRRSHTDPLTREPLRMEDLRPNLALKEACAQFLEENGWAVDW